MTPHNSSYPFLFTDIMVPNVSFLIPYYSLIIQVTLLRVSLSYLSSALTGWNYNSQSHLVLHTQFWDPASLRPKSKSGIRTADFGCWKAIASSRQSTAQICLRLLSVIEQTLPEEFLTNLILLDDLDWTNFSAAKSSRQISKILVLSNPTTTYCIYDMMMIDAYGKEMVLST